MGTFPLDATADHADDHILNTFSAWEEARGLAQGRHGRALRCVPRRAALLPPQPLGLETGPEPCAPPATGAWRPPAEPEL